MSAGHPFLPRCRLFSIPPFLLDSFPFSLCFISPHYLLWAWHWSLHDFCPPLSSWFLSLLPSIPHRLVKLFIISSARFQSVPFSSQVKSHHPQARVTTSKNAVALFKAGVTTAYFICVCFSHVRNKGGRIHLLIWLHLKSDNFFEMKVICSFMWMQMPNQSQTWPRLPCWSSHRASEYGGKVIDGCWC